jgi:serine/threonine protein kinase/TM2 domain-containing membrane protein YozV
MKQFRYKYGDRPLDGYTIQRAAGWGGFGEVYYAISDSGRQVALKEIQNYEQIELRGVSQCMNLKSPHLVSIFDVKYNQKNHPFVVMEYVSGVSLRDLIKESPNGLGTQKAAFFLREIAKGLSFLHECGIVHRDLKPSNIFYENGYVKIGDYGLTKAISASRHSGQTITVGTVHYMAPEIGAGCYDRSIDIYALGVLLYEMLTGQVPFFGASPAEILMKHMSAEPELDNIEEPFAQVIRKALAKDPADRYKTIQEMVEDVFGSETIRNSVSQFSPEALSIVAERVAKKVTLNEQPEQSDKSEKKTSDSWELGQQIGNIGDRIADRINSPIGAVPAEHTSDPIDQQQRLNLAVITMIAISLGAGLFGGHLIFIALLTFLMIGAASKTILMCKWDWIANLEKESIWLRRFATGGLAALAATLVTVPLTVIFGVLAFPDNSIMWTWLTLTVVLGFTDWPKITAPQRRARVSLEHALWLGLLGLIASFVFAINAIILISVLAGTSLVVQIASGFTIGGSIPAAVAGFGKTHWPKRRHQHRDTRARYQVPPYVRFLWLVGFIITLGGGTMLLTALKVVGFSNDEKAVALSLGICSLIFSLFAFTRVFCRTFTGWHRYLIKPMLLLVCLFVTLTAFISLNILQLHGDEELVALFFIIFPGILFLVLAFIPSRIFETPSRIYEQVPQQTSPYKRIWALLFSGGMFLGIFGIHRFYVGKIGTGILWLLTFGLFGIGQIVDIIMIFVGQFKDCHGRRVTIWIEDDELRKTTDRSRVEPQPQVNVAEPVDPPQQSVSEEAVVIPARSGSSARVTIMPSTYRTFDFFLSTIGYVFLFLAILLGLAIALHLPVMIAAGSPEFAQEMNDLFGYTAWPQLLERIGLGLASVFLLLAAVFIIIARSKSSGPFHIIRAILGVMGLVFAMLFFSDAMQWPYPGEVHDMLKNGQLGPALEKLLQSTREEEVAFALILVMVSVILLAWPAKQQLPILNTSDQNQEANS